MKTKLRTTYLVTVLFFLFVTVGSMILFYNMFSEDILFVCYSGKHDFIL